MHLTKIFIILSLFHTVSYANNLKGYNSPKEAMESFVKPLKQGSKGVNEAISSINSLNGDSYEAMGKSLKSDIKENGKVLKMKELESDSRLNGLQQKVVYEIEYANGKKRTIQMNLIKPSEQSGFHIMKMDIE